MSILHKQLIKTIVIIAIYCIKKSDKYGHCPFLTQNVWLYSDVFSPQLTSGSQEKQNQGLVSLKEQNMWGLEKWLSG